MGGSPSSSGSTQPTVPKELKPLITQTGANTMALQSSDPLSAFTGANPTKIAPLTGTQKSALGLMNQNLSDATKPLENSDIVNAGTRYFNAAIAPNVIGQATLSGLGRSTAATNALSAAQAQTMLPLLQQEQARRDAMINQGLSAGDVERSVEQQGYNALAQDALRRQAIAEQALFVPLGQLVPSTIGSKTTSTTSGGGLSVLCTELHRQGLMSDEEYESDEAHGRDLPLDVIAGYHRWGVPLARVMRKSKVVTRIVKPFVLAATRQMGGKESLLGRFLLAVGVPLCRRLGRKAAPELAIHNTPEKVKFRHAIINMQNWMEQKKREGVVQSKDAGCVLTHHFAPIDPKYGCCTYAREIFIPKGSLVIGKIHKHQHLNFILKGKVSVGTEFGKKYFKAPCIFVSEVGLKRAVYAEEDTIWTTVHLTEFYGEQYLDKIEDEVIAKSYEELGLISNPEHLRIGAKK